MTPLYDQPGAWGMHLYHIQAKLLQINVILCTANAVPGIFTCSLRLHLLHSYVATAARTYSREGRSLQRKFEGRLTKYNKASFVSCCIELVHVYTSLH